MQEGAETITSPNDIATIPELKDPFTNATPLGPEFTNLTQTPHPEKGATDTMTEHPGYQPQTQQEKELMDVIAKASGGDPRMLDAMKQGFPTQNESVSDIPQPKPEPTGLMHKIGVRVYDVLVYLSKLLGVKAKNPLR